MSFDALATSTASTNRSPAVVSGLRGARVVNLTNVKIHPIMPLSGSRDQEVRSRFGMKEQAVKLHETFTEQHSHTDSSVTVNQVPDIKEGDEIVVGSDKYNVLAVRSQPTTAGMTAFLELTLEEAK